MKVLLKKRVKQAILDTKKKKHNFSQKQPNSQFANGEEETQRQEGEETFEVLRRLASDWSRIKPLSTKEALTGERIEISHVVKLHFNPR